MGSSTKKTAGSDYELRASQSIGPYVLEHCRFRCPSYELWSAYRSELVSRPIDLVVLRESADNHDKHRLAFLERARQLATVRHPNLLRTFRAQSSPEWTFAAVERQEGLTLAQVLNEGALNWAEAALVTLAVTEGVDAMHQHGVYHGHIDLDSILISVRGHIRLTCFSPKWRELTADASRRSDAEAVARLGWSLLAGRTDLGGDFGSPPDRHLLKAPEVWGALSQLLHAPGEVNLDVLVRWLSVSPEIHDGPRAMGERVIRHPDYEPSRSPKVPHACSSETPRDRERTAVDRTWIGARSNDVDTIATVRPLFQLRIPTEVERERAPNVHRVSPSVVSVPPDALMSEARLELETPVAVPLPSDSEHSTEIEVLDVVVEESQPQYERDDHSLIPAEPVIKPLAGASTDRAGLESIYCEDTEVLLDRRRLSRGRAKHPQKLSTKAQISMANLARSKTVLNRWITYGLFAVAVILGGVAMFLGVLLFMS